MSPRQARRPPGTAPSGVSSPGAAVSESGTFRPGGDFGVPSRAGAATTPTCSIFEPGPRTRLHEPAACALGDPWPPGAETVSGGWARAGGDLAKRRPSWNPPRHHQRNPCLNKERARRRGGRKKGLVFFLQVSGGSGSCPPAWNKETGTQTVGRGDAAGTERALWGMLQGDVPSGTHRRWCAGAFAWGGAFQETRTPARVLGELGCPLILPLLRCSVPASGDKVGSRRGLMTRDCKERLPGS